MHTWNDDWPHWAKLEKAERWINKFYRRMTGKYIISKEKYGTIRYELVYCWIGSEKERDIFFEVISRACDKFPDIQYELVEDMYYMLPKGSRYKHRFDRIVEIEY